MENRSTGFIRKSRWTFFLTGSTMYMICSNMKLIITEEDVIKVKAMVCDNHLGSFAF